MGENRGRVPKTEWYLIVLSLPRETEEFSAAVKPELRARYSNDRFRVQFTVRTVVTYPSPTLVHPRARAQPFTFTLRLTYPAQLIRYIPSLQETLLKAWIQYFAVAWLIGTITHRLVVFAVKYHLIRTEMAVDRVPTADMKRTNGDFGRFKMGFM